MSLRTSRKNAWPAHALHDIHNSCQNRTLEGAPICTVVRSAYSAYIPDLLSKVGINKSRDIGPMRSCSCLVVLSVSSATLAREVFFLPELSAWIKHWAAAAAAATTKAFFSFYSPSHSPAIAWASVCFLLLLLTLPRPGQLRGSFRGAVANGAKAFHF